MKFFSVGDRVNVYDATGNYIFRGEIRGKAIGKDFYDVLPERAKSLADMRMNIAPERLHRIRKPQQSLPKLELV